jgi:hypothetical protein
MTAPKSPPTLTESRQAEIDRALAADPQLQRFLIVFDLLRSRGCPAMSAARNATLLVLGQEPAEVDAQ